MKEYFLLRNNNAVLLTNLSLSLWLFVCSSLPICRPQQLTDKRSPSFLICLSTMLNEVSIYIEGNVIALAFCISISPLIHTQLYAIARLYVGETLFLYRFKKIVLN